MSNKETNEENREEGYNVPDLPECCCDDGDCRTYSIKECQIDYLLDFGDKILKNLESMEQSLKDALRKCD